MVAIASERRALAQVGLTDLVLREQWRAARDYTDPRTVVVPATTLFAHITVTNPRNYSSHAAHVRAVEAIGILRFPNTGISYSCLLPPDHRLYEGQPLGRRGAHSVNDRERVTCTQPGCPSRGDGLKAGSYGWNLNYTGRALGFARNVGDPVADEDVRQAARWFAALKLSRQATRDARIHGHRCVAVKDCPGDRAWARIGDISDLTADYVRRGHVAPTGGTVSATGPEKWDAADWAAFRANVNTALRTDSLFASPGARNLAKRLWPAQAARIDKTGLPVRYLLDLLWAWIHEDRTTLDKAVKAIMAMIAAGEANDLTEDQVRAILKDAVVKVHVEVGNEPPPEGGS